MQVSELKVLAVVEKVCDVKKAEGDWIQWIDLVEEGPFLEVRSLPCAPFCPTNAVPLHPAATAMGF